jgi:small subunit ribosomal protein S13
MYILDTQLKDNKIMILCLKGVFGLGLKTTSKICKKLGLSKNIKGENLSKKHLSKLNTILNSDFKLKVSNELKKLEAFRLQKLISIKCYRGLRRVRGLPVRGQRTHTNAKTAKRYKL